MNPDDLLQRLTECESPEQLEALAAALPSPRVVRTLSQVAKHFGVQPQSVRQWRLESPPAPGRPGAWDLDAIEAWRTERAKRNEIPGMAALNVASMRAELARRLESVRGKKLKNDRMAARVIPRTEAERDLRYAESILEARLQQLPDDIAASVPEELAEAARELVEHTIEVTLAGLRNDLAGIAGT